MGLGTDDFLRKEFLKTSFDDVRGSRIHQSVSMQSSEPHLHISTALAMI